MTNSLRETPICGAASPTPRAAYIVSNMSETSRFSLSSNSVTGSPGVSSTRSPYFTISKRAIALNPPSPTLD